MRLFDELNKNAVEGKNDEEMLEIIEEEFQNNKEELKRIEQEAIDNLIVQDKYDLCNDITIEIRAGVGGSESSLFSEDILNMYNNYCTAQGWSCKVK